MFDTLLTDRHLFEGAYLIEIDEHWGFYAGAGIGFARSGFCNGSYNCRHPRKPAVGDIAYSIKKYSDYDNAIERFFISNLLLGARYRHNSFYVGLEANIGYGQGTGELHTYLYPDDYKYTKTPITERVFPVSAMLVLGISFDTDIKKFKW